MSRPNAVAPGAVPPQSVTPAAGPSTVCRPAVLVALAAAGALWLALRWRPRVTEV